MTGVRFELAFIDRAAQKEYLALDGSVRGLVDKGLARLAARGDEIGKPLSGDLAGCRELKFRAEGLRVVYRIVNGTVEVVEIIAIGHRSGGEVFGIASRRIG